ncbi:hypothetical protein WK71_21820 [Burkholderia ubonensis]|nr:hypothetical protein WK71_21820 [Burkholderia ubonensis]
MYFRGMMILSASRISPFVDVLHVHCARCSGEIDCSAGRTWSLAGRRYIAISLHRRMQKDADDDRLSGSL